MANPSMPGQSWICSWYKWKGTHPDYQRTCQNPECSNGHACLELHALGLDGGGKPLPRKQRPYCNARNRQGKRCGVRVESGKTKCRFHGGKSTGPKTKEGRARIAFAQRKRWAKWRAEQGSKPVQLDQVCAERQQGKGWASCTPSIEPAPSDDLTRWPMSKLLDEMEGSKSFVAD